MKKLSICIPTYNRSSFLQECFQAFEKALSYVDHNRIEIVISDNASVDSTQDVIERFTERNFCEVKNILQSVNTGWKNLFLVTEYATGDYVWIVSDDDKVGEDSLKSILFEIDSNPSKSPIILNIASFEPSSEISKPFFQSNEKYLNHNAALKVLGRR
jgi:abequosyltransferase